MFANRYTVLVDACSLASVWRRNLLLSLAEAELFRLRWSPDIIAETEKTIAKILQDREDHKSRAAAAVAKMVSAFPEAHVYDYQAFLGAATLPDKNDQHVLAAALKTRASMLVTENTKDFPSKILSELNLEVKSSDEFIADAVELDPPLAIRAVARMRARFKKPPLTADEMLLRMEGVGLTSAASTLRPYLSSL